MTVPIWITTSAGSLWEPVTVSGNFYQELIRDGIYLGRKLLALKLFDGDTYNFKDKKWSKGKTVAGKD